MKVRFFAPGTGLRRLILSLLIPGFIVGGMLLWSPWQAGQKVSGPPTASSDAGGPRTTESLRDLEVELIPRGTAADSRQLRSGESALLKPRGGEADGAQPAAGGTPTWRDDVKERVLDAIEAQLSPARLQYNRVSSLAVGETVTVKAGLTPLLTAETTAVDALLAEKLGFGPEAAEPVTIKAAMVMIAQLTGDPGAFKIVPLHGNSRQALGNEHVTGWQWEVTGLSPGRHELVLALAAEVRLGQDEVARETTYTNRIVVHIDPVITGSYVVREHWLPLLGMGFLLGTGLSTLVGWRYLIRVRRRALVKALSDENPIVWHAFVFLSYSRRNEGFAIRLASDLTRNGLRVWIDQRELRAGEDWTQAIAESVARADALVLVLSPHAVRSQFVMQEIEAAAAAGKPILPVIRRRCRMPPLVANLHAVDFTKDYGTAMTALLKDLKAAMSPFQSAAGQESGSRT